MSVARSDRPERASAAPDGQGEALSLPISCPRCGMAGRVGWTSLQNSIRCPECDCEFVVARGGRILRVADLPRIRYACPRCSQSGAIPAMTNARRAKCPGCRLPLAQGPDQRLHGVREAAQLWKSAAPRPPCEWPLEAVRRRLVTDDGKVHKANVALAAAGVVVLMLMGGLWLAALFDRSPETLAREFTERCLNGREEAALEFLEDEAVQYVEFQRWTRIHFASILNRHRPQGDEVTIDVQAAHGESAYRVLLVTMRSPFIGSRSHLQLWRRHADGWLFDSRATLADAASATEALPQSRPSARRETKKAK